MKDAKLTAMDILVHVDRSNCRECGAATCMAFAALVVQGRKNPADCPRMDPAAALKLAGRAAKAEGPGDGSLRDARIDELKARIRDVDLPSAARRAGCVMKGDRVEILCLGKRFEIDPGGGLHSECHVNPWVHLPLLHYIVHTRGRDLEGEWVLFRDLPGARAWARFFEHRCEEQVRRIAGVDADLFLDALDLFSGLPIDRGTGEIYSTADVVMILHPLPRVPILVAWWHAGGEFESRLNLLFDRSASDNLGAEVIFGLGSGLVEMLKKIMLKHGHLIG